MTWQGSLPPTASRGERRERAARADLRQSEKLRRGTVRWVAGLDAEVQALTAQ
jgi:hypothetical protein